MRALFSAFAWRMAWRDSRGSRRALLFFALSIVLGIAALVAVGSLESNLRRGIDDQARELLGADLELKGDEPFSPEIENLIRELGGQQARGMSFASMAYFPVADASRLVRVRAVESGYPFFGKFETTPPDAGSAFLESGKALPEASLALQFGLEPGGAIRLGYRDFRVAGVLDRVPGNVGFFSNFAPRVYVPLDSLESTGLLDDPGLVRYQVFFRFEPGRDVEALVEEIKPVLEKARVRADTIEETREDFGDSLGNVFQFLNLTGFVALLLGSVGIASAIHAHVKQKMATVAVLRCLGAGAATAVSVYLIQAMAIGLVGAVLGGMLGGFLQTLAPSLLAGSLPFEVSFGLAWWPLLRGMGTGFAVCLLFALAPLAGVRGVPPLAALRTALVQQAPGARRSWWVYALIACGAAAFAVAQAADWEDGLAFFGGLVVVVAALGLLASLLMAAARRFLPAGFRYEWRQGVANLHRPGNRTVLVVVAIGLTAMLLLTVQGVRDSLLREMDRGSNGDDPEPNLIVFDIQSDQLDGVTSILDRHQTPPLEVVPVVTMRLHSLKGVPVSELMASDDHPHPRWALRREYRSTFRPALTETEELAGGVWVERFEGALGDEIPVSLETGIAKELGLAIGDPFTFDIQGITLNVRVASLREVNWRRFATNFFVVFPPGSLDGAPLFYVAAVHAPVPEVSASIQGAVVKAYPTVSVIDFATILQTIRLVLEKVSQVVRVMGLFIIASGLVVFVATLLTGRTQRMRESVLLRTLGAARSQVRIILAVEFFALGTVVALASALLAALAVWALATWLFEIRPVFLPAVWLPSLFALVALTVAVGLATSRGISNQPPLAALRDEEGG
ncbi:ABC transporter permease [soil metagenome]